MFSWRGYPCQRHADIRLTSKNDIRPLSLRSLRQKLGVLSLDGVLSVLLSRVLHIVVGSYLYDLDRSRPLVLGSPITYTVIPIYRLPSLVYRKFLFL